MLIKMRPYLLRVYQFDTKMCIVINHASQNRLIRDFFRVISRLGDGVFWYSLMAILVFANGYEALFPVVHMGLAGLTGTFIYKWLKRKTLRPRPFQVQQAVRMAGKTLDQFSFPSGHTLHAVVFTYVALSYFPFLWPLLIPFTLLVGISRVVLGLHYPSDVLAGTVIGITIAYYSFVITG